MAIEDPGNLVFNLADFMGIDNLISRLLRATERTHARKIAQPFIISGVSEMLEVLGQRYEMAVISARSQPTTLDFLESSLLKRFFSVIVTGQTCAPTKPHPMPVLWAAAQMGIPPEACLMVGDTTVDIRDGADGRRADRACADPVALILPRRRGLSRPAGRGPTSRPRTRASVSRGRRSRVTPGYRGGQT